MIRIMNVSSGEITYIDPSENIPEGWIAAPLTFTTSASAAYPTYWLWLLALIALLWFLER